MCVFIHKLVPKTGLEEIPLIIMYLLKKSSEIKHEKKIIFLIAFPFYEGNQCCLIHILSVFIVL